jgi:hypothetical protein
MLEACRASALELHARLAADSRFVVAFPPELDIVVWAVRAPSATEASEQAHFIFSESARRDVHLALAELPVKFFPERGKSLSGNETVACLRSVVMKPEHAGSIERILASL